MIDHRVGPPCTEVRELDLDGEISLFDPRSSHAIVLNSTASDVWRLADGEHCLGEIVDILAKVYGTAPQVIRDDVTRVVGDLMGAGLLPQPGQPVAGRGQPEPVEERAASGFPPPRDEAGPP